MALLQERLNMKVMACDFTFQSGGTLEFGAINPKYEGSLKEVQVNPTGDSWTVDNVQFNISGITKNQPMTFGAFTTFPRWYLYH